MKDNRKQLKVLMALNDMSAADIGEMINRKPGTVRHYMCGRRLFSDELLELLKTKLEQQETV